MRIPTVLVGLLAVLTPLASAWSKDDREIFRVRDELTTHEGAGVTFYDFLGVSPTATLDEINKAYRKRTRLLHPDKVKQQLAAERARASKARAKSGGAGAGAPPARAPSTAEFKAAVKRASERQERLSIVANILRGPGRDRYDHFLANGFPAWKGTGYYYSRYRPGLGSVLAGVFLFAGGAAHYLALYMAWRRRREFVDRYISFARHAAWGENLGIPGVPEADAPPVAAPPPPPPPPPEDDAPRAVPVNRKMRRLQERDARRDAARDAQGGARRARKPAPARGSGSSTPQPQPPQGGGPTGPKKRVVAENGKVLVVDSLGDVYLEQDDEEGNAQEYLLDPEEFARPTLADTAVVRLPLWVFRLTVGRAFPSREETGEEEQEAVEVAAAAAARASAEEDDSEPGKLTPGTDSAEEFELLEKSVDDLGRAKTTGASQKQGKAGKRKGRKR